MLLCATINFLYVPVIHAQVGWQWGIGGNNDGIDVYQMTIDKAGNSFVAGSVFAVEPFFTLGADTVYDSSINYQMIITKTDSSGNVLWVKGTQNGNIYPTSLATDTSGDLYVICNNYYSNVLSIDTFTLSDSTGIGVFMIKLSPEGVVLWVKNIVMSGFYPDGCIGIDGAGYVYVTGDFISPTLTIGAITLYNADTSMSSLDAFIAKFDATGSPIWVKGFGNVGNDEPLTLSVTKSGNIYITGSFDEDTLDIGGMTIYGDTALSLDSFAEGNNFFTRYDSSGNVIWAQYLSYHENIFGSATDANNNVYLAGGVDTGFTFGTTVFTGSFEAFLAKYDISGTLEWDRAAGGANGGNTYGIAVDNCGKIWVSGGAGGSLPVGYQMYFGADTLSFNYGPSAADPMYIVAYDTGGNYVWGITLPSGGDDYSGLAVDNNGNFYVGGDYEGGVLAMALGPDTLPAYGTEILFIAKYKYDTVGCRICTTSPVPDFSYTGDAVVHFTYTGATSYDSLVWNFGDGILSNVVDPVHTYTTGGVYDACVSIYSSCISDGGVATYCSEINVPLGIANIVKPGEINIYPDPATDECTISYSSEFLQGIYVAIYDMAGRQVSKYLLSGSSTVIFLGDIAPGMYECRIGQDNGSFVVKKLVIMR